MAALAPTAQPEAPAATPAWIEALSTPAGFVAGLPQARSTRPTPPCKENGPPQAADPPDPPDPLAEALARGEALGRAAAQAESDQDKQHSKALRLSMREFDQAAIDALASDLAETVIALCSQTIADYAPDPARLKRRCEEAATRLGKAASDHSLHLNPLDIELLDAQTVESWQIVADPAIERGGLHFEGPDGAISDGPVEWRRAIAAAIRG